MTRARSGKTVLRGRKRMRRLTKGFRLSRHHLYRQAVVTLIRARVYAFRERGLRYGQLIAGLIRAQVQLNRKTLAEIAIHDPDTFTKIVELARANLPAGA